MSLKQNIVANYASQIYGTIVGIITVPMYINYMGAEAYGLIGFFAMLQVCFNLLDMGLTPTMSRESARFQGGATSVLEYLRLARALEGLFGFIALAGCALLFGLAGMISEQWLNTKNLSLDQTITSLQVMALIVAMRWMSGYYRGVITGTERLVWLSGINILVATARFVLVLPILIYVSNDTLVYFYFQLIVAIFELGVLANKAYRLLPEKPKNQHIKMEWEPIKPVLKFSLSIAFTSSIWVLVTQTDKLILSKILSLADYGYFTVAVLLASGIMVISGPIINALMPRMARLHAEGQHEKLIDLYRNGSQAVTVASTPVTLILAFFSSQVLWAWTGNEELVNKSSSALSLYAIGYGFLAVGAFPYYLQYAKGDLKLHVIGNGLFVVVLVPSVIWAANQYGMSGAGWAWLISNAVYFFIWVPLVHRKFAPGLHLKWIFSDIMAIAMPAVIVAFLVKKINFSQERVLLFLELTLLGAVLLILCVFLKKWKAGLRWSQ